MFEYKLFEPTKLRGYYDPNFSYFHNFPFKPKDTEPPPGFEYQQKYRPPFLRRPLLVYVPVYPVYHHPRPVYGYQMSPPMGHPVNSPMNSPMSPPTSPRSDLSENASPYSPRN